MTIYINHFILLTMRKSQFLFVAFCMLLLFSSCTSNNDIQDDSKFSVQSILNNQSITLPSIEKTLGTTTECTEFYSSENGYVSMSGNSFEVDGNQYYPLNVAANLMVRRWVKKENNGKTVYSPLWSYLCSHKGDSSISVVSYGPDARFLQNYELDEEVCKTQLPMHEKYSGTVFESDLDGTIIGGAIYFNGKKTWTIQPENIEHFSTKCLVQRNGSNMFSILFLNLANTRANFEGYDYGENSFVTFCDGCVQPLDNCECTRCPTCQERMADCECEPNTGCEYCSSDPCRCEICVNCGNKKPECTCPPVPSNPGEGNAGYTGFGIHSLANEN